jgi:S-adenosyl-L-methionine hydrolase (adenosine-forming)
MPNPIVTFTSDFGLHDWFVGVVHGVIYGICPDARLVDITHTIAPGDIEAAAFVLEASAHDFPPDTIHLAVVDPGVGTERLALAVEARGQCFVGPDNGVLDWALADPAAHVHALEDKGFFREPMSRTFHGRDVFAPVAAHIACGVPIARFGRKVDQPVRLATQRLRSVDGRLEGRIAYIDRFGNALTDVGADSIAAAFPDASGPALTVEVVGRTIRGITHSYGDARIGTLVALIGSSGRLEIAEVGGHGASRFGFGRGDPVVVSRG